MERRRYLCLLCGALVGEREIVSHKELHSSFEHYGLLWPLFFASERERNLRRVPTYQSPFLAERLGVKAVYVRDEGANFSGSMKDYLVEAAVTEGITLGYTAFTVVSSGNHAVALAKYANIHNARSIVFVPASSSKIPVLAALPGTLVIGIKDAIFEDVYEIGAKLSIPGVYNANVSNELLLSGLHPVARGIACLDPIPTHVLSGVGNGSYLAGIALGMQALDALMPKIVPVGMDGAFPTEKAFQDAVPVFEYQEFLAPESTIDAAEGSIAIASYSMPQLMYGLRRSEGFPLGGITNTHLAEAYEVLIEERSLFEKGAIPEPTGIMGLAAALQHKERFAPTDVVHLSFTGHGVKDREGIERLLNGNGKDIIRTAERSRPELIGIENAPEAKNVIFIDKGCSPEEIRGVVSAWMHDECLRG